MVCAGKAWTSARMVALGIVNTPVAFRKRYCYHIANMNRINRYSRRFRYRWSMTPAQCRMARAAIQMGVRDLAEAAKVSTNTITRFERGEELLERTVAAICAALEAAGVEFTNGEQPGVKLRKRET